MFTEQIIKKRYHRIRSGTRNGGWAVEESKFMHNLQNNQPKKTCGRAGAKFTEKQMVKERLGTGTFTYNFHCILLA